eukprot:3719311-Rhodomonas_salina.2
MSTWGQSGTNSYLRSESRYSRRNWPYIAPLVPGYPGFCTTTSRNKSVLYRDSESGNWRHQILRLVLVVVRGYPSPLSFADSKLYSTRVPGTLRGNCRGGSQGVVQLDLCVQRRFSRGVT